MTKTYIAYTRVSTARQWTEGVSLKEQHRAIQGWQVRQQMPVVAWYIKAYTAVKRGRQVFEPVLRRLRAGKGSVGLVIRKIDRVARKLRDWADSGELLDLGIDVRFVHEDFDLDT
jgi:site-specific DNA recombinase